MAAYIPQTVTLDGRELAAIKAHLHDDNKNDSNTALPVALDQLTTEADGWLTQGPWSVVDKAKAGPSGNLHDYVSQAPYYWPDPARASEGGLPYIQRDGQKNPEVLTYTDRVYVEKVFRAAYVLALASFYTDNAKYATHAARVLRTWFVAPATAMRPNLDHAQLIPGVNTGRAIGIIDFSQAYASVLDAAILLREQSPKGTKGTEGTDDGWTDEDDAGFRDWNRSFLAWLVDGAFGQTEHAERSNHGSFAAMLVATIAAYVGDTDQVAQEVAHAVHTHIPATIEADGRQPAELARTRSWHYSTFNLLALTRLAMVADRQDGGERLWPSLFPAVEYVLPAATGGRDKWPHPDLQFEQFAAADVVRAAAAAGHAASQAALPLLAMPPDGDMWPLRPAPEQLDPVRAPGQTPGAAKPGQ
ncbi:hypothetical protein HMPREF1624_07857 [Sporothrix schenckii ATCC 58251]|uniref:Alginate lyase domain-containing protein n=1 Tax=Sporothrix schenckii (strain ATCC 58251 / de Perez 2211183) TaxID=1391915 RepID=U7PJQ0_SPOS1|nr:hypothetical protein HMPREF1624_07857 [Sporothrix schenckii ATCC 58251]